MKMYLMTPGPTPVAPETQLAMAQPIIHHRSPQFMEILGEVREGLKYLFQTEQEVLIFTATGTGAMEGAVTNTLSAGDTALVVDGGKFGERWTELCNVYGVKVKRLAVEWGRAVDPKAVAKILDANPDIKAVLVQANETSTGGAAPGERTGGGDQNPPGHHPDRGRHFGPGRLCAAHGRVGHRRAGGRLAEGHDAAAGPGLCGPEPQGLGVRQEVHPAQILLRFHQGSSNPRGRTRRPTPHRYP